METEVLEEVQKGNLVFTVMSGSGDDKLVWDASDPRQITAAIERFDKYMDDGYAAFLIDEDGQQGEQITKRDWERLDVRQREEILFRRPQEAHLVPNLQAG